MKKKTQFLLNLALTAIFFILIIFQGPNLNPLYPDGAFSWCFIISCYVVLNFFVALGSVRVGANEYGRPQISIDKSVRGYKRGFVLLAILWVLYFGVSILSMPLFNYKAYRDQLGVPAVSEFTDTVQPLALTSFQSWTRVWQESWPIKRWEKIPAWEARSSWVPLSSRR